MKFIFLLAIVAAASIGQVMLKLAVHAKNGSSVTGDLWHQFLSILLNGYFWAGVGLYGFTSLAWLWALKNFPLSKAYPVLALTFVLVPLLARGFLGERIMSTDYLGMALILLGVGIIGIRM